MPEYEGKQITDRAKDPCQKLPENVSCLGLRCNVEPALLTVMLFLLLLILL